MKSHDNKKVVDIVIPAYNEEETLGIVLRDVLRETKKLSSLYTFRVIVVDNDSKDNTNKIAQSFPITVVNHPQPGKGEALRKGFSLCNGDYVVMLDADYSHRAEDLHGFLTELQKGAMLVIGSRSMGGSDEYNGIRGVGNFLLTWIFQLAWGVSLTDVLNGYKAFRREVVILPLCAPGFEIEIELIKNALLLGGPVTEVSSHERARAGGEKKSHAIREGFRFLMAILKYGILYRYQRLRKRI